MNRPLIRLSYTHPADARGWIGLGCYTLVWAVLAMIAFDKTLLDNNAFLVIASALVLTGWNQGPVGWAYQATKGGGEAAESNARIAEKSAQTEPQSVIVTNEDDNPIPTKEPKP